MLKRVRIEEFRTSGVFIQPVKIDFYMHELADARCLANCFLGATKQGSRHLCAEKEPGDYAEGHPLSISALSRCWFLTPVWYPSENTRLRERTRNSVPFIAAKF
jgi:hypothetical protein